MNLTFCMHQHASSDVTVTLNGSHKRFLQKGFIKSPYKKVLTQKFLCKGSHRNVLTKRFS